VNRRQLLKTGMLGGLAMVASPLISRGRCRLWASEPLVVSTRAVDLVLGSTVIDMLSLLTLDWSKLARWQESPAEFRESDYRQLEASGVNIFHPAVETGKRHAYRAALHWVSGWNRLIAARGCFLARIDSIASLQLTPKLGKLGVLIGFQNSDHFRTRADVETFYRLGQRVSQLTYNGRNRLGSGCYEATDRGLTPFGAEVVAEMNRVGMAIDVSHCGERTSLEAIGASRQPVLATHANCRALVPGQPRCKSDAVIRRLARGGGVIGLTVVRAFVGRQRFPTIDDLLDHFDHVVRVAGVEHVGLGSDVDFVALEGKSGRVRPFYAIRGLDPPARVFQIADGLLRRGYAPRDVQLILGGNFRRALAGIFPDSFWSPLPERETRRDPFCPAPRRVGPSSRPSP
jgi:membrane dipeptidase